MKILFLGSDSVNKNGTLQRMLFLARALAKSGVAISVGLIGSEENRNFCGEHLRECDVRYIASVNWIRELFIKRRMAREGGFDVVHSFCIGARFAIGGALPVISRRHPVVLYDWDELISAHSLLRWRVKKKYQCIERYSLRTGNGYTAASRYLAGHLRGALPTGRGNVLYLPNGYDRELDSREGGNPTGELIRADKAAKKMVYVGAITKGYQISELLEMADLVRSAKLNWKIFIVGTGADEGNFRRQADVRGLSNIVTFTGWVPVKNIAAILKGADALLFPFSPTTQNVARCPLKIFQYIASGVPVVTNRVGEVASALGEAGYYYEPADVPGMLAACREACSTRGEFNGRGERGDLTWDARAREYLVWLNGTFFSSP